MFTRNILAVIKIQSRKYEEFLKDKESVLAKQRDRIRLSVHIAMPENSQLYDLILMRCVTAEEVNIFNFFRILINDDAINESFKL